MPDVICNTSPLQYLHQLKHLNTLHKLSNQIIVPNAVAKELEVGRSLGIDLPDISALDWINVRSPLEKPSEAFINDLGPGESEVLMLASEFYDPVVILDDGPARKIAEARKIRLTGTLGILIDVKRKGLIDAVSPLIDQLQILGFRLAPETRLAVLKLADELL